jgi:hypothetical protein
LLVLLRDGKGAFFCSINRSVEICLGDEQSLVNLDFDWRTVEAGP